MINLNTATMKRIIKPSHVLLPFLLLCSGLGTYAQTSGTGKPAGNMQTLTRTTDRQQPASGEKVLVSDAKELTRVQPRNATNRNDQQPVTGTSTTVERRKRR